jgi:4-hydroxybenzoate polyprenyltransferase
MAAYKTSLDLPTFWTEMFKFLIAAFLVRGSACTINDIFDRNFDAGVGKFSTYCTVQTSHLKSSQNVPRDALSLAGACLSLPPSFI